MKPNKPDQQRSSNTENYSNWATVPEILKRHLPGWKKEWDQKMCLRD
jgi:hypothetical protein